MQLIDDKDDALVEITEALSQKQTFTEILDETYKLQITHQHIEGILDVLRTLIRTLIKSMYGIKEPPEAD